MPKDERASFRLSETEAAYLEYLQEVYPDIHGEGHAIRKCIHTAIRAEGEFEMKGLTEDEIRREIEEVTGEPQTEHDFDESTEDADGTFWQY